MKLKLFFSMMAIVAMLFTGCKNDETALEVNYGKTAFLQGKVILKEQGTTDKVGANVKIFIDIPYDQLISDTNPNGNSNEPAGHKQYETISDENGKYKIELPAIDGGTEISIYTETKVTESGYYKFKGEAGEETSNEASERISPNRTYFVDLELVYKSTVDNGNNQEMN